MRMHRINVPALLTRQALVFVPDLSGCVLDLL